MISSHGNVKCWRGVWIAAAAIIAFLGVDVHAQDARPEKPREFKLSVAVGPAFALGKAAERWGKLVGEKSAGRVATTPRTQPYPDQCRVDYGVAVGERTVAPMQMPVGGGAGVIADRDATDIEAVALYQYGRTPCPAPIVR